MQVFVKTRIPATTNAFLDATPRFAMPTVSPAPPCACQLVLGAQPDFIGVRTATLPPHQKFGGGSLSLPGAVQRPSYFTPPSPLAMRLSTA